jgi:hypothetical protein
MTFEDLTPAEQRQKLYLLLEELPFEERRALASQRAPREQVIIAVNASRRARAHPRRQMVVRDLSLPPSEQFEQGRLV